LYWKPLSRPTDHATCHTAHLRESSLLHDLRSRETAVPTPADDDDFLRGIKFFHTPGEAPQGNMDCTWDIPLSQFIWLTDINDYRSSFLLRPRFLRCHFYDCWFTKKITKHSLPFLDTDFLTFIAFV
jgi:hypothetical protein